jgi:glycosyltransferase involved in cell wall biosynthesis
LTSGLTIGVEASPLGRPDGGGLWTALYYGLGEMAKLDRSHRFVLYTGATASAAMIPAALDGSSWQLRPIAAPRGVPPSLWLQSPWFARASARDELDVLWLTRQVPASLVRRTPKVTTVHDLLFHRAPETLSRVLRAANELGVRASVRASTRIITPSRATARDLVNVLGVDPGTVDVAYNGVDRSIFFPRDAAEARAKVAAVYGAARAYILAVEVFGPRKNFATTLEAYRLLPAELRRRYALVATGRPAHYARNLDVPARVRRLGLERDVHLVGWLPAHRDLGMLYASASLLVYPSVYEGFGLPVLEAMACGCPVVTSAGTATAEVGGSAALYVPFDDPAALAAAMERVLGDEAVAGDLRERGIRRAAKFSWEAYAAAVLTSLRRAVTLN